MVPLSAQHAAVQVRPIPCWRRWREARTERSRAFCSVSSLPNRNHTLVLGVQPDQVVDGIAVRPSDRLAPGGTTCRARSPGLTVSRSLPQFDYFTSTDEEPEGTATSWRSDFNDAVPPSAYRNTTATPFLPSATASLSPAPSSTSPASSSSGVNKLAVGLGAGLGGFFALLALVALVIFFVSRKRRQLRSRASHRHEALGSYDDDSNWYPEPASEAGQLGGLRTGEPKGSPVPADGHKNAVHAYEDSPVSAYGYEASPGSGTGYEGWSPDPASGATTTYDSRTPFGESPAPLLSGHRGAVVLTRSPAQPTPPPHSTPTSRPPTPPSARYPLSPRPSSSPSPSSLPLYRTTCGAHQQYPPQRGTRRATRAPCRSSWISRQMRRSRTRTHSPNASARGRGRACTTQHADTLYLSSSSAVQGHSL